MVGLINSTVVIFEEVFVRLLNIHFNIGILDNKGVPFATRSFSFLSIPPSRIVSSLCTRRLVEKLSMDWEGGEPSVGRVVKSAMLILMPNVTWSSPDTTGVISMAKSASTGV